MFCVHTLKFHSGIYNNANIKWCISAETRKRLSSRIHRWEKKNPSHAQFHSLKGKTHSKLNQADSFNLAVAVTALQLSTQFELAKVKGCFCAATLERFRSFNHAGQFSPPAPPPPSATVKWSMTDEHRKSAESSAADIPLLTNPRNNSSLHGLTESGESKALEAKER